MKNRIPEAKTATPFEGKSGSGRQKLVLCAEYQGHGAVRGSTTGFQRSVQEIIEQAGAEGELDVIVYCMGTDRREWRDPRFGNVFYRQYRPNLSVWEGIPGTTADVFPFLVDLLPFHPRMIRDLVNDAPAVIHTFQTFGAVDLAGYVAARRLRRRGHDVRLVSTVMTEIDTYFAHFTRGIMSHFCARLRSFGIRGSIADVRARPVKGVARVWLAPFAILFWALLHWLIDGAGWIRSRLGRLTGREPTPIVESGLPAVLSRLYSSALSVEIPLYLARCDAVTTSRPEDARRYLLAKPVWETPLACDHHSFRVIDEDAHRIGERLLSASAAEARTDSNLTAIERLVSDPALAARRPILYVGRHSEEKNFRLVLDAYQALIEEGMENDVHLVLVGAGTGAGDARERFGDRVSVCGLLPNGLLPLVYNLVRARDGFLVSASDTETYGIVHQEAGACGLPLVAMERGTRTHLFVAGDLVGNEEVVGDASSAAIARLLRAGSSALGFELETDHQPSRTANHPGRPALRIARNGLVVCDQSAGSGLCSLPPGDRGGEQMRRAFELAVAALARLPEREMKRLSAAAADHTNRHRASWATIWEQLRCVYADDRRAHARLADRHRHVPAECRKVQSTHQARITPAARHFVANTTTSLPT